MKILYVPSQNLGTIYWRIESYAQALVELGEQVNVDYFGIDPSLGTSWDILAIGHGEYSQIIQERLHYAFDFFDVIVFQKIQHSQGLEVLKKIKRKFPDTKMIFETDDHIGDWQPSNIYADKVKNHSSISAEHAQISDALVVSTNYLAETLRPVVGSNKPIYVAPNCLKHDIWKVDSHSLPKNERFRFVYVGGGAHDEDLLIAYKAFKQLQKTKDGIELIARTGGYKPIWFEETPATQYGQVNWHISEYPQKLYDLNADCALAPLRDTEFNRCKSNIKWIEWSSIGVPLVASNVEPYRNTKGDIVLANNDIESFRAMMEHAMKMSAEPKLLKKQEKRFYNISTESGKLLHFFKGLCKI